MVVNEKVLVREMKEAYKGWGYGVMVRPMTAGCSAVRTTGRS